MVCWLVCWCSWDVPFFGLWEAGNRTGKQSCRAGIRSGSCIEFCFGFADLGQQRHATSAAQNLRYNPLITRPQKPSIPQWRYGESVKRRLTIPQRACFIARYCIANDTKKRTSEGDLARSSTTFFNQTRKKYPAAHRYNSSLLLLELLGNFPGELDGLIHLLRRHFLFERREIVSRIGIAVACGHIPPGMCPDCVPDRARS